MSKAISIGVSPISKATPAGSFFWFPGTDAVSLGATNMEEMQEKSSQFGGTDKGAIALDGGTSAVATLWSANKAGPVFDGSTSLQYFRMDTVTDPDLYAALCDVVDATEDAKFLWWSRFTIDAAATGSDTIFTW